MNFNEEQVLLSLWRWKVLSTATLTELHFSKVSPTTAYYHLSQMRKQNLIHLTPVPGSDSSAFYWCLTVRGFREVLPSLPQLKDEGYKSESLKHDGLVSAIHLGDWVRGVPPDCAVFSEQELRRLHLDQYPSWVPAIDIHRPDGYWLTKIGGDRAVIALEVELTRKSGSQYRGIGTFYSNRKNVTRILWVVRTMGIIRHVQKEIKAVVSQRYLVHDFVLLKDYQQNGWNAKIILGEESGFSMGDLLSCSSIKSSKYIWSILLQNTKKSPHMTKTYSSQRKFLNSDRVGSNTLLTPSLNHTPTTTQTAPPSASTTNINTKGERDEH